MNLLSRISPLLALLLLIGCAQNPSASGKTAVPVLAPAGAGFSVNMPGTPKESVAQNGNHIFASEVNDRAYIASYFNLPPQVKVTPANVQGLLDFTRDGIIRGSHAKLLADKRSTLDGQPAREVQLRSKEGYFMQFKLAFVNARLYQVGGVVRTDKSSAPEIAAFIDSFRFTAQK